jgi:hypothetical protein
MLFFLSLFHCFIFSNLIRLGTLLFDSGSHGKRDQYTYSFDKGGRGGQEQLSCQGVQKEPQSAAIQIMPVPDLRRGRSHRFSF